MDSYSKDPYVLPLTGITVDDYKSPEDLQEERIKEKVRDKKTVKSATGSQHIQLPAVFTNDGTWPLKTNRPCWNCGFTFDGAPRFIPKNFRSKGDVIQCDRIGIFCCFNCAARYVQDTYWKRRKTWQMLNNLNEMYKILTGRKSCDIKPAPSRFDLIEYEGTLTRDEFWAILHKLDPEYGLKNHTPGSVVPERMRTNMWEKAGATFHKLVLPQKSVDEKAPVPKPPLAQKTLPVPNPDATEAPLSIDDLSSLLDDLDEI